MNFSDFESWFEENKNVMPLRLKNDIETGWGHYQFIFMWKEYERIVLPKLTALLYTQYPQLQHAHESFAHHIKQNIEHRIFELMEEMWRIVTKNREGISPAEALPKTYPNIQKWKIHWNQPRRLVDFEEESKQPWFAGRDPEETRSRIEEMNREIWEVFNRDKKYYETFIELLQPDLLQLLPELLNMDAAWWDVYVFYLRFQCDSWKHHNERFCYLTEYGLTAEWLEKTNKETNEEIDRIEKKQKKKA